MTASRFPSARPAHMHYGRPTGFGQSDAGVAALEEGQAEFVFNPRNSRAEGRNSDPDRLCRLSERAYPCGDSQGLGVFSSTKDTGYPTTVPQNRALGPEHRRTRADGKPLLALDFSELANFSERRQMSAWCPEEDSNLHALQR